MIESKPIQSSMTEASMTQPSTTQPNTIPPSSIRSRMLRPRPIPPGNLSLGGTFAVLVLLAFLAIPSVAADIKAEPSLDTGFRYMYDLDFPQAHQVFLDWQQQHPADPMGPVSDAAGVLFSELNRLGVLEQQFYEDDHAFDARKKFTPDAGARDRFNDALEVADSRSQALLAKDPKSRDGLFAMTLSSGLQADYAALIEKRNLASLHYTRDATAWAQKLLAVDSSYYDAYVATGVCNYIVGSMSAPMRWILRLGGVAGDKQQGIAELQRTADHGHYLGPFARILLAIAYVHDKDKPRARGLLVSLRDEFPDNPLFAREIARLDQ